MQFTQETLEGVHDPQSANEFVAGLEKQIRETVDELEATPSTHVNKVAGLERWLSEKTDLLEHAMDVASQLDPERSCED